MIGGLEGRLLRDGDILSLVTHMTNLMGMNFNYLNHKMTASTSELSMALKTAALPMKPNRN